MPKRDRVGENLRFLFDFRQAFPPDVCLVALLPLFIVTLLATLFAVFTGVLPYLRSASSASEISPQLPLLTLVISILTAIGTLATSLVIVYQVIIQRLQLATFQKQLKYQIPGIRIHEVTGAMGFADLSKRREEVRPPDLTALGVARITVTFRIYNSGQAPLYIHRAKVLLAWSRFSPFWNLLKGPDKLISDYTLRTHLAGMQQGKRVRVEGHNEESLDVEFQLSKPRPVKTVWVILTGDFGYVVSEPVSLEVWVNLLPDQRVKLDELVRAVSP